MNNFNDRKTWLSSMDRTPFDEQYHQLESIESALTIKVARNRPTFWAA